MKKYTPAIIISIVLLIIWEGVARYINAMYILPSPSKIIEETIKFRNVLFTVHLKATLSVTIIGLFIAVILGVGLAISMDLNKSLERALYPLVVATQTVPITALAPLFVLWFGYGIWSKVIVTVLITFFPITVNVYDGFKSTKREMEELLLTYGASKKGFDYMKNCPNTSLDLLLNNHQKDNFPLTKEIEEESMNILLPKMENENSKFLSQSSDVWQQNIDWLYDKGFIKNKISVDDVFINVETDQ